jgi:hypothetical protein
MSGRPVKTLPARKAPPPLGRFTAAVFADLARKTRFVDPALAARWTELAGPEIARLGRPGRLTGGGAGRTLEIVVPDGTAAARVAFEAEALRRRLNDALGPGAIRQIVVRQRSGEAPDDPRLATALSRFRATLKKRADRDD